MRKSLFAAAALGLAVASPGFGQPAGTTTSPGGTATPPGASAGQTQQRTQQVRPMTQDQVRQQLTQAGFQDVRILDTAFLVQARTREGNPVIMMINPPDMPMTSQTGMSGSQGATGAPGGMPGQGTTGSGGPGGGRSQ